MQYGVLHEPTEGGVVDSLILRVKCTKSGFPHKDKFYAMKVVSNFFKSQTTTQVGGAESSWNTGKSVLDIFLFNAD